MQLLRGHRLSAGRGMHLRLLLSRRRVSQSRLKNREIGVRAPE